MIAHLLPHESDEWVRLVGPINVVADNRLYAIVDVDTAARKIAGIPQSWRALLTDEIVGHTLRAEARMARAAGSDEEQELRRLASSSTHVSDASSETCWNSVAISPGDILTTPAEHWKALTAVLVDAQSTVVIATSGLAHGSVESVLPHLQSALQRDLLICVLWCVRPDIDSGELARGLELLKKLEYDSSHGRYVGRLVVNSVALGSTFNALIAESQRGIDVYFGSLPWLQAHLEAVERHATIRLHHFPVGARLCDFAADLASKDERIRTSGAITGLRKLAAQLRSASSIAPSDSHDSVTAEANVFFDEAVGWYIGETVDESRDDIHVDLSEAEHGDRLSFVDRLISAKDRISGGVAVSLGGPAVATAASAVKLLEDADVPVSRAPELKANIVIVDGNVATLVNRSWTAKSRNPCRPYGTDVALGLRGTGVAKLLLDRMTPTR